MDKNILRSNDLKFFIIDFDSTFITLEGLDVLASISLKKTPEKIAQIEQITRDGMVGKIGFRESLELRIKELGASVKDLEQSVKVLKRNISPSILRNKKFFKQNKDQIYIISGGFEEMILPVVLEFGILPDHVLANKFLIKNGEINGFDKTRPTSEAQGKARAVRELGLKGEVIVVGDGFTDLEIKRLGAASKFVAYTENVSRESIIKDADMVVRDFDELLFLEKISSEVSYPKSRMKVLLLENIEKAAEDNFKNEGYQVEALKTALDEKELIERIKNISILGIRSKTKISQNVLNNARKLKAIGTFSIGTDQVDLGAALQSGVSVFNAPYQNTRSVVELAIGEIIALSRGIAYEKIWPSIAIIITPSSSYRIESISSDSSCSHFTKLKISEIPK